MPVDQVYPRPTVKTVIFQIVFPSLFYLESRIGDIQARIMDQFPESSLLLRRSVLFTDMGPEGRIEDLPTELAPQPTTKVWRFRSPKGYELGITLGSLDITSSIHKSYRRAEAEHRFRDVIAGVLDAFFEVSGVRQLARVGLRYIDECPVPSRTSQCFSEYYYSSFPLERFPIEDASEMVFRTVARRGAYQLGYVEALKPTADGGQALLLDFDASAKDVRSDECLRVTDALHDLIIDEFNRTAKEPLFDYMKDLGGA